MTLLEGGTLTSGGPADRPEFSAFGNRTVFLGDSITLGGTNNDLAKSDLDWGMIGSMLSGGRLLYVRNAGVSGDRLSQMAARLDVDVLAHSPSTVVFLPGANDAGDGAALASFATQVRGIVDRIRAAGARVILCTTTPHVSTTRQGFIQRYILWMRDYAAREGLALSDFHTALVDPATGGMKTAYTTDNLHPIPAGTEVMAQTLAATVGEYMAPLASPLPSFQTTGSTNLIANALFLTDTNADGVADGWTKTGVATSSLVAGDEGALGNWQRLTDPACTTQSFLQLASIAPSSGIGWAAGDRIAFVARVRATIADTTSGTWSLQVNTTGGSTGSASPIRLYTRSLASGVLYYEFTVPTGTAGIQPTLIKAAGTGGAATLDMAQLGLFNLTRLGLIAA